MDSSDLFVSRRKFVAGAGLGAGALILGGIPVGAGAQTRRAPFAREGTFPQGVAAGEPGGRGMTLWTRLEGETGDRRLAIEIARDPDFARVVYRRNVTAKASEDGAVKLRVERGLRPGERYYYRFSTRGSDSPVGRFQTLRPYSSNEPVRIAFFSCQDYGSGYYNAQRAIAQEDDLDMVVCLGDYIYEKAFYDGPRRDTLGANGDGEVMTLPEYRQKYQLYKSDPDLQAMHAAHPFMSVWDDHEVEDNYAADEPGDAADDRRVPFELRQRYAYRAFFENQPFRRPVRMGFPLYRTVRLGRTAELFLLDERQYRDDQPCGDQLLTPCPEASEPRSLLGPGQREWLKEKLAASQTAWKLIGNQVMVMALELGPGTPLNKDQWDGYATERRDILQHVRSRGIEDVSFLTGDIHTFFAGDVGIDGRGPDSVATEFVGGSATSLGIREGLEGQSGAPISPQAFDALAAGVRAANPHIKYDNLEDRGYGLLEATQDELKVQYKAVDASRPSSTTSRVVGSFRVARGEPRVEEMST